MINYETIRRAVRTIRRYEVSLRLANLGRCSRAGVTKEGGCVITA